MKTYFYYQFEARAKARRRVQLTLTVVVTLAVILASTSEIVVDSGAISKSLVTAISQR